MLRIFNTIFEYYFFPIFFLLSWKLSSNQTINGVGCIRQLKIVVLTNRWIMLMETENFKFPYCVTYSHLILNCAWCEKKEKKRRIVKCWQMMWNEKKKIEINKFFPCFSLDTSLSGLENFGNVENRVDLRSKSF